MDMDGDFFTINCMFQSVTRTRFRYYNLTNVAVIIMEMSDTLRMIIRY